MNASLVNNKKKVVNKVVNSKSAKSGQKAPKQAKKNYKPKNKPVQSPTTPGKEEGGIYNPFGGRPPKYKTVEELQSLISAYFRSCWKQKLDMFGNPIFVKDRSGKKTEEPVLVQFKPYTVSGMARAIGTTRDLLIDYEAKDKFSDTIKRAKQICQEYAEESLFVGKNPTGAIFNLKNNWGWKDKTETEHSGNLTWTEEPPK